MNQSETANQPQGLTVLVHTSPGPRRDDEQELQDELVAAMTKRGYCVKRQPGWGAWSKMKTEGGTEAEEDQARKDWRECVDAAVGAREWPEPAFRAGMETAKSKQGENRLLELTWMRGGGGRNWSCRNAAKSQEDWQRVLMHSAAGGFVEGVARALDNGAGPNKGVIQVFKWTDGKGNQRTTETPHEAYLWQSRAGEQPNDGWRNAGQKKKEQPEKRQTLVALPLEASIASRSRECIETLLLAGANPEPMVKWLGEQELNKRRVEGGIALAEALASPAVASKVQQSCAAAMGVWLQKAGKWLNRQPPAKIAGEERWEEGLTLHRRLAAVSASHKPPLAATLDMM